MVNKYLTTSLIKNAINALNFGFTPIPLKNMSKVTSLKWDPWIYALSEEAIESHWTRNPTDELGIIVGDNIIVYDADTPESLAKLYELEKIFDIQSNHTVTTKKGEHHYFLRPNDVIAKSNSHSTKKHPERIDVKTGRSMVVRPPSTGKEMLIDEAESVNDFTPVTQEFIDAINHHNGNNIKKTSTNILKRTKTSFSPNEKKILQDLLNHVSSTCSHDEWLRVGMIIHNETVGSNEGLSLWNEWSKQGDDYSGFAVIEYKYHSFDSYKGEKYTLDTLALLAEINGADSMEIKMQFEENFELCDTEVINSKVIDTKNGQVNKQTSSVNSLAKYSLIGKSAEYEALISEEQFVIGNIALKGQITVFYAQYNTGKTLIVIALLIKAIEENLIKAKDIFYVNADDNHRGLVTKLAFADEFRFNMLAPGHNGFKIENFTEALIEMTSNGTANNTIVIVDTLKKFTDLMDKRKSSNFAQIARQFVSKGGTIILLGHVNKRSNAEDKAVHAGTSDIIDDSDCAYILDTISEKDGIKTVLFENTKSRGCVASKAAYQYVVEDDISYNELIATVSYVKNIEAEQIYQEEQYSTEESYITAIESAIEQGINTKMKLADSVAKSIGQSKRKVIKVIEKYTGTDPLTHRWSFKVAARGAKIFELLSTSDPVQTDTQT